MVSFTHMAYITDTIASGTTLPCLPAMVVVITSMLPPPLLHRRPHLAPRGRGRTSLSYRPSTSSVYSLQSLRVISTSGFDRQQQTAQAADYNEEQNQPAFRASGIELQSQATLRPDSVQNKDVAIQPTQSAPSNAGASGGAPKSSPLTAQRKSRTPKPQVALLEGAHVDSMLETLNGVRKIGLPDAAQSYQPEPAGFATLAGTLQLSPKRKEQSKVLLDTFNRMRKLTIFRQRMADRVRLPMMAKNIYESLIQALDQSDVLVLAGATGCGKTTQVPQIILDYAIYRGVGAYCNIVCTQPRRISATSVAKRVAYERCEPVGHSVGYQVRFQTHRPAQDGSILYCTAGVLLKQISEDLELYMERTSHIVIDEVHERNLATDHLLAILKEAIQQRKANGKSYPKLLLMSATIETQGFLDYFKQPMNTSHREGESVLLTAQLLEVPGRMFPVETKYLEDFLPALQAETDPALASLIEGTGDTPDQTPRFIECEMAFSSNSQKSPQTPAQKLLEEDGDDEGNDNLAEKDDETVDASHGLFPAGLTAATVAHVARTSKSGDILVFLPGLAEIERTARFLTNRKPLGIDLNYGAFKLFKLHSSLSEFNDTVFDPVSVGVRRIVLATTIAESSITLPHIEHVIDMGRTRHSVHDHTDGDRETSSVWTSKANARQRLGRAGRVRPGTYWALFTRKRHESFEEHPTPDITRTDIVPTCLEVLASRDSTDVAAFLATFPTPPKPANVATALQDLEQLGATTERGKLTALGRLLSLIPLDPTATKAVVLGVLFKCLGPMLVMACHDHEVPLVDSPFERRAMSSARRAFARYSESDLISSANAFKEYDEATIRGDQNELATLRNEHYIRRRAFREIQLLTTQVYMSLASAEIVPPLQNRVGPLFPQLPSFLNTNAGNIPLLKAILLSTMTPNLAMSYGPSNRRYRTRDGELSVLEPRTVNDSRTKAIQAEIGRECASGDLLAYSARRETLENGRTEATNFILGGSMVTPLMAALFGTAAEKLQSGIMVDGFVNLRFGAGDNVPKTFDDSTITTLVLEYRKAIQRFLFTAFEDLRYAGFKGKLGQSYAIENSDSQDLKIDSGSEDKNWSLSKLRLTPTSGRTDFSNTIMRNSGLRDAFVDGIAKLLTVENDALMELFKDGRAEAEEQGRADKFKREAAHKRLQEFKRNKAEEEMIKAAEEKKTTKEVETK